MILLFAKYPVPGQVKTRLIPALGATRAARLHRRMTETTLDTAKAAGSSVVVCAAGAPLRRFRAWLGKGPAYVRQSDGDLGRRMEDSFDRAFRLGARKAIAIGADVPGITPDLLRKAFEALDFADVVLGPAADGGYYLIGMRQLYRQIFRDIAWGSGEVLSRTREILAANGISYRELPVLSDVDRPEDLSLVRDDARLADALDEWPRLSVVIPTLNEEDAIASTLAAAQDARHVEIIVADGGSTDRTREIAQAAGAQVLEVPGGRAAQMNAGAAAATGGILLFLHADTRLPESYSALVRAALDKPGVAAGAFRFRLDASGRAYRIVERLVNWRSQVLDMPYGDQALFMKAGVFMALGGFPDLPIMEDFEMVRRLRRRGQLCIVHAAAVTSARRWECRGIMRTTILNQAMIAGYVLGVPPRALARLYRGRPPHDGHRGCSCRQEGDG